MNFKKEDNLIKKYKKILVKPLENKKLQNLIRIIVDICRDEEKRNKVKEIFNLIRYNPESINWETLVEIVNLLVDSYPIIKIICDIIISLI